MNTFQKLSACLLTAFLFLSYGCGKDDPVSCNYTSELQDETNALIAAGDAYGADPNNPAKCQAWKDAYQDYLNAAETYVDCATTAGTGAELQASIDSAQAALDQIQC